MKILNLSKSYFDKTVVDDVSIDIPKGKITSFIGPNGAGKSTVMSMISRLISKDEGIIEFKGKDISKWKSRDIAKHLAILSQTNNINIKLSVKELVSFGRFPYSGSRLTKEDLQKVDEAISSMELYDLSDKYIDELSGGQKQRAFIAMVIAQDTEYVLLDEPTNNLDIYHSIQTMKNISYLSKNMGKTIIMVLHELNLAAYYSDYICSFKDGKVAKFGKVDEVMTKQNLSELYNVDFEIFDINGRPLCVYC
ncbi:iron ABC transporter ATP-binding protein [Campylobacter sputorum]|uniref:iron ABC transporter ATP-binding protein n=1 Tax=Campylobacter sputorum TaxID=206 RepID=UPI001E52970E|nr:ATP-binding cassette domain-containing protein [Campylobacter sputorum]